MAARTSIESGEKLQEGTRERILAAALDLLNTSGRDALTTRAVAEAAGVQPPVIYRHFRDKEGMLEALAEHGFCALSCPETTEAYATRSGRGATARLG